MRAPEEPGGKRGSVEALSEHARAILPRLRLYHGENRAAEKKIRALLQEREDEEEKSEHRDTRILLSCDGVSIRVAAAMLVEAGPALRSRDYQNLRLLSGRAPVTRQSGKKRVVLRRHACNRRLANALHHWARVNVQVDPYNKNYYQRLRARGHSHGRALRTVGDRLLRVLVTLLKNQETYVRNYGSIQNTGAAA